MLKVSVKLTALYTVHAHVGHQCMHTAMPSGKLLKATLSLHAFLAYKFDCLLSKCNDGLHSLTAKSNI